MLLDQEEKEISSARAKKAQVGQKKAKQYDAAEAQRKALLKQMAKMGVSQEPEAQNDQPDIVAQEGEQNAQLIEEIKDIEEVK